VKTSTVLSIQVGQFQNLKKGTLKLQSFRRNALFYLFSKGGVAHKKTRSVHFFLDNGVVVSINSCVFPFRKPPCFARQERRCKYKFLGEGYWE
jgi:hypothetical protein